MVNILEYYVGLEISIVRARLESGSESVQVAVGDQNLLARNSWSGSWEWWGIVAEAKKKRAKNLWVNVEVVHWQNSSKWCQGHGAVGNEDLLRLQHRRAFSDSAGFRL